LNLNISQKFGHAEENIMDIEFKSKAEAIAKFPFLEHLAEDAIKQLMLAIMGFILTKDSSLIHALTVCLRHKE